MTTIEYACIVEGGTIIAQHPPVDQLRALGIEGFPSFVRRIVANTSSLTAGQRKTFREKERSAHAKVSDLRVFVCIAPSATEPAMAYGLLDYLEREATTTPSTQWAQMIADRIAFIADAKNAKLADLTIAVDDTRNILMDAVDSVMQRGEKMTTLLDTTEDLARPSQRTRHVVVIPMFIPYCNRAVPFTG